MNTLHESSPHILNLGRSFKTLIAKPQVSGPLVEGDTPTDRQAASIYGSVIQDGGIFRMWYQAWPEDSFENATDPVAIGYAESDDGLDWRKPNLGQLEYKGKTNNNLLSLMLHSPSVFIDPTAPASHRYRATGRNWAGYKFDGKPVPMQESGYCTAHSSDGLHWELDENTPRWPGGDVITSCWDEFNNCGYIALKDTRRYGGLNRRTVWNATLKDGEYSEMHAALIPDDYDDLRARESGGIAGDYYGMGWLPQPDMTCGLLWNFRIDRPLSNSSAENYCPQGLFGKLDLSLVWRENAQSVWRHLPGRPTFLDVGEPGSWTAGMVYTASHSLRVGDEEWMYIGGSPYEHGFYLDASWQNDAARMKKAGGKGSAIGLMRWKAGRLMGLHAPLYETMELELPDGEGAANQFFLNARAWPGGSVRGEVYSRETQKALPNYSLEDCVPLDGDDLRAPLRWQGGSTLPSNGKLLAIRLHVERAAVYGFEVKAQ